MNLLLAPSHEWLERTRSLRSLAPYERVWTPRSPKHGLFGSFPIISSAWIARSIGKTSISGTIIRFHPWTRWGNFNSGTGRGHGLIRAAKDDHLQENQPGICQKLWAQKPRNWTTATSTMSSKAQNIPCRRSPTTRAEGYGSRKWQIWAHHPHDREGNVSTLPARHHDVKWLSAANYGWIG